MNTTVIYIVMFAIVISIASLSNSINRVKQDLSHMNNVLHKIAKQVGVPEISIGDSDSELEELILNNKKIEAIKRYRMKTGMGLKESKDYIDELDLRLKN